MLGWLYSVYLGIGECVHDCVSVGGARRKSETRLLFGREILLWFKWDEWLSIKFELLHVQHAQPTPTLNHHLNHQTRTHLQIHRNKIPQHLQTSRESIPIQSPQRHLQTDLLCIEIHTVFTGALFEIVFIAWKVWERELRGNRDTTFVCIDWYY